MILGHFEPARVAAPSVAAIAVCRKVQDADVGGARSEILESTKESRQ